MATLNGKTVRVSKVVYSPIQKEGEENEKKTIIVVYEDSNQQLLNGGVDMLKKQKDIAISEIEVLNKRVKEFEGIIDLINNTL